MSAPSSGARRAERAGGPASTSPAAEQQQAAADEDVENGDDRHDGHLERESTSRWGNR